MDYISSHVGISNGGIISAIKRSIKNGCSTCQIFVSSPKTFQFSNETVNYEEIKELVRNFNFNLIIHGKYIYNFSRFPEELKKSFDSIYKELEISELLGSTGVVIHMGKRLNLSEDQGIVNYVNAIQSILVFLKERKMKTKIIIETGCGCGTEILKDINKFLRMATFFKTEENFGICIDTCHVFAGGLDIRDSSVFIKTFEPYKHMICCIHLNDSKDPFNSNKDNHENIGAGNIGQSLFEIAEYCIKNKIPAIMETPSYCIPVVREVLIIKESLKK